MNVSTVTSARRSALPPEPGREGQILFLLFVIVGVIFIYAVVTLPDVKKAGSLVPAGSVAIFDRFDRFVCSVADGQTRERVSLSAVPLSMRQAVIAIEDKDFYKHEGISPSGIARAFLTNLQAGRIVEGGSTITQQLAKNLFLDTEDRSLFRKAREAVLALQLENTYSKDQILEIYLNRVYFGRGAYGIHGAASAYFGKKVSNLNLSECAFLAGLLKAPSTLGKAANVKSALERQHLVLGKMAEYGFISPEQAQTASKQRLRFRRSQFHSQKHPYYISTVITQLKKDLGEDVVQEGVRVYTNMDVAAQTQAERTLSRGILSAPYGINQGAMVSISVSDGSVVALVGGVGDYLQHQFNRATSPHTLGSSFKPFVYLTAFVKRLLTPDTTIVDEPVSFASPYGGPPYEPHNFDNTYMGPLMVRQALGYSRNACSVKVAASVGIAEVINTAKTAGLNANLDNNLSLALGSSAASPLDMAGAFGTFARGGQAIEPWLIRKVESNEGQLLRTYQPTKWNAFNSFPVSQLVDCLQFAVEHGTGVQARLEGRSVAGKTGTSDKARDLWFVGFTPDVVTAVWGGNDQYQAVGGGATGGAVMAGIWRNYMSSYYREHVTPPASFSFAVDPWSQWWQSLQPSKPKEDPETQKLETPARPENEQQDVEVDPEKMNLAPVTVDPNSPPQNGENGGDQPQPDQQQRQPFPPGMFSSPQEQQEPPAREQNPPVAPAQAPPVEPEVRPGNPVEMEPPVAPDYMPPRRYRREPPIEDNGPMPVQPPAQQPEPQSGPGETE